MNEVWAKILKLLFNKTTLAYMVLILVGIYGQLWFRKSEYSPKSIKESIDNIGDKQAKQSMLSTSRDSILEAKIDEIQTDQYLMRIQIDTIVNYQTPALINRMNMMSTFYKQLSKTGRISPPEPLSIKEPIKPKYDQTLTLINDIGLSFADTTKSKKKSY